MNHALCEILYYRNLADALYTHFFHSLHDARVAVPVKATVVAAALVAAAAAALMASTNENEVTANLNCKQTAKVE